MKRIQNGLSHLTRLHLSLCVVASSLTALLGSGLQAATSYSFTVLGTLGDSAPGGGNHINDFEPGAINRLGSVIYGTDLGTTADPSSFFGEGVFLRSGGTETELVRAGGAAPGGGVFDFLLLGQTSLNDAGNAAFAFTLSPFSLPVGANSGLYRYSRLTQAVTPAVVPYVTPAPAGGTFSGVFFGTSLNNKGDLLFSGIFPTAQGIHVPGQDYIGLGTGVFKAAANGQISNVASPGDAAPGGGTFDWAQVGYMNNRGDVVFNGHVAGEEIAGTGAADQSFIINALGSLYLKNAGNGKISSIVHSGDAAPGGGAFRQAYSAVINDRGAVAFLGDLSTPPDVNQVMGVYLYSGGALKRVAGPGDQMPGGGTLVTASSVGTQQVHINNPGQVVFNGILGTDVNADGILDTGLFLLSGGSLQVIARTGTVLPGVGTVENLVFGLIEIPPPPFVVPNSGAINNDLGQIMFGVSLTDGRGVLVLATPNVAIAD
jgi:hypothetical protein